MATLAEFVDPVDELLKCSICLHTFTNPKSLPCLHTFCLHCIQRVFEVNTPGDSVACPNCRHKFVIPRKGVEKLPSNFFIKNLIDSKKSSGKSADDVPCDVCSSDSELNPSSVPCASMCCKTCGQKLCNRCSKPHQMIPGGAHQVVTLNKHVVKEFQRSQDNFCSSHGGNRVVIYCLACCKNICVTCHAIKHQTHNCRGISDICGTFRQTLENDVSQIASKETSILQEKKNLELKQKEFEQKIQDSEKTIHQSAADLKSFIDESVNQLVIKLAENKAAAVKMFNKEKRRLEFSLASMQTFTRFSRELIKSGKDCDISQAYENLHKRADELLKKEVKTSECRLSDVVVTSKDFYDKLSDHILGKSSRK